MLVLERPGWIRTRQRRRLFIGTATREYATPNGQRAWSPFAQRIDVCAAKFPIHVGMKSISPGKQRHFAIYRQSSVKSKRETVVGPVFEPVRPPSGTRAL